MLTTNASPAQRVAEHVDALGMIVSCGDVNEAIAAARQLCVDADRDLTITRAQLAEALREVEVTNSAARILADERGRAHDRVASLEERNRALQAELARLRQVPEIGGVR